MRDERILEISDSVSRALELEKVSVKLGGEANGVDGLTPGIVTGDLEENGGQFVIFPDGASDFYKNNSELIGYVAVSMSSLKATKSGYLDNISLGLQNVVQNYSPHSKWMYRDVENMLGISSSSQICIAYGFENDLYSHFSRDISEMEMFFSKIEGDRRKRRDAVTDFATVAGNCMSAPFYAAGKEVLGRKLDAQLIDVFDRYNMDESVMSVYEAIKNRMTIRNPNEPDSLAKIVSDNFHSLSNIFVDKVVSGLACKFYDSMRN